MARGGTDLLGVKLEANVSKKVSIYERAKIFFLILKFKNGQKFLIPLIATPLIMVTWINLKTHLTDVLSLRQQYVRIQDIDKELIPDTLSRLCCHDDKKICFKVCLCGCAVYKYFCVFVRNRKFNF